MAAPPTFAQLEKMSAAQQDAFFTKYLALFKGTVAAGWVANDPSLAPYEGDTALQMYEALQAAYPAATPLQRGSTVYQAWLANGLGSAVQKIVGAAGTALGAAATAITTADYLPSWSTGLAGFLSALTSKNTWIRTAEVVIGLVLLAVGLNKALGNPAGKAAKTAAAVAR